jgi:hypothetical protein
VWAGVCVALCEWCGDCVALCDGCGVRVGVCVGVPDRDAAGDQYSQHLLWQYAPGLPYGGQSAAFLHSDVGWSGPSLPQMRVSAEHVQLVVAAFLHRPLLVSPHPLYPDVFDVVPHALSTAHTDGGGLAATSAHATSSASTARRICRFRWTPRRELKDAIR